jgi:iron(III) transport system ATP-binding protein
MIRVRELELAYEGSTTLAVKGISFDVAKGKFFSLLGPSGCGKTTSLRSIAGLEIPDAGEIMIGDTCVFSAQRGLNVPSYKRGVGMVFQSYAIWPHMSVFANVAFPLTSGNERLSRQEVRKRVEQTLELVGLSRFIDRDATRLSGGQQQRLALARALVHEPKVLLLDEPLSNLDAKLREHMRVELRRIQQELGISALYVTHDQEEALAMSDRIAVMHDGEIVQEDSPENIYRRPATEFVANFIGTTNLLRGLWRGERLIVAGNELMCPEGIVPVEDRKAVSIRPEDIELAHEFPAGTKGVLSGVVKNTVFLGRHYDTYVAVGEDVILRVFAHHGRKFEPGENVQLRIPPESVTVLRKEYNKAADEQSGAADDLQTAEVAL